MKNKLLLFFVVITTFFLNTSNAQQNKNQVELSVENQNDKALSLIKSTNAVDNNFDKDYKTLNNNIFIQQIGTSNQILSTVQAPTTTFQLQQKGEYNLIQLEERSKGIKKIITQNGNNNKIIDISSNPGISTTLEVLQYGNDHYLEKYGSNSLSNSIKIKMSGEAQTIIIRSF